MKQISLCSIANVSSGNCSEDCAYCTQSAHNHTNIEKYKFRSTQDVVNQAKIMRSYGAVGFCLVTAGLGLDSKKCEYIAKLAFEISRLDLFKSHRLQRRSRCREPKISAQKWHQKLQSQPRNSAKPFSKNLLYTHMGESLSNLPKCD